jgi:hypothetical protein
MEQVSKRRDPAESYPNATLVSDWDVVAENWTALRSLGEDCEPRFHHVYGHQDDKHDYDDLTLEAQLNVDADQLAEEFLQLHLDDVDYCMVPPLPTSGIQLNLKQGTVTHHLKRDIRLARTTEPLEEYLCNKNEWDQPVFESVDWQAHGKALTRQKKHKVTFVKYLHGLLPVGRMVNRYDKKYPKDCPSCETTQEETCDHLHKCPAPSREAWRKDTISELKQKLEKLETAQPIMELFLEGMTAVLQDRPIETIRIPPGLEDLAAAQAQIGWSQLLKGRMSVMWRQLQQAHLGHRATAKHNGMTWVTDVIDTVFCRWWTLWTSRNDDRHGRDKESQAEAAKAQAIREVKLLYDMKDSVLPQHRGILQQPLEQKLQWNKSYLRAWINTFKPLLEKGYNTAMETG